VWLPDWFKKRNTPAPIQEARIGVLALSIPLIDRFLLERLGERHSWSLRIADSPREGFHLASQRHFEVILCDRHQPGYPWREVMDRLAEISPRSCILLVSPVNDDYLWGDVLQHGGYDILIRPLREVAVLHAIDAVVRFISPASSFCAP
jgi:DNA-binding NarL/FixJ family response regulator